MSNNLYKMRFVMMFRKTLRDICNYSLYVLIRQSICLKLLDNLQIVWTLIRQRVLRRLIWVYMVCLGVSVPILLYIFRWKYIMLSYQYLWLLRYTCWLVLHWRTSWRPRFELVLWDARLYIEIRYHDDLGHTEAFPVSKCYSMSRATAFPERLHVRRAKT